MCVGVPVNTYRLGPEMTSEEWGAKRLNLGSHTDGSEYQQRYLLTFNPNNIQPA